MTRIYIDDKPYEIPIHDGALTKDALDQVIADNGLDKSAIELINLPDLVEKIGERTFANYVRLQYVNTSNVTYLGDGAFYSCKELISINVAGVEVFGAGALMQCSRITEITIGESVTELPEGLCHECFGLQIVTVLSMQCTRIKEYAFHKCHSLSLVKLGGTDRLTIEEGAFTMCHCLEPIEYSGIIHAFRGAFWGCTNEDELMASVTVFGPPSAPIADAVDMAGSDDFSWTRLIDS